MVLPSPSDAPWLAPALWLVARGTVLLALAALAVLALRRAPAAGRHLAWSLALAGMLALPALSLLAPHWELPFVRVAATGSAGAAALAGAGAPPGEWGVLLFAVWAAGAALVLGRYALAVVGVRLAARGARRIDDSGWRRRVAEASRELGLREEVRLLSVEGAAMPMTWGILHPVVLLPAEAEGWSEERRRVVLLHELAHVARRDCLWQGVAALACAAYWFHPGAWLAAWRMRVEREQACDDRVLAMGTRPSDYARHLLEVARACRPRPFTAAAAVGLARRSQLEVRVVAVLDAARAHGAVPLRSAVVAAGVAGVVLFPLAAARPDGVAPPAEAPGITVLAAEIVSAPAQPAAAPAPEPHPAAPPLADAAAAASPPPPAPLAAAESVRRLRADQERAIAALLRATHDPDPEVRRSAVSALGRVQGGEVVGPLVRSMADSDARVRSAAAAALGELAARPPAPSAASAPPGSPPPAARAASAPLDPALRILGALGEDSTFVDFPAGAGPGAM